MEILVTDQGHDQNNFRRRNKKVGWVFYQRISKEPLPVNSSVFPTYSSLIIDFIVSSSEVDERARFLANLPMERDGWEMSDIL